MIIKLSEAYTEGVSLDDIENKIVQTFKAVDDVDQVEIFKKTSDKMVGRIKYADTGKFGKSFTAKYKKTYDRNEKSTEWNPAWTINDDGSVFDSEGNLKGYFKLLKRKPEQATPSYEEDSIEVVYGGKVLDLNDQTAEEIASDLKTE